MKKLIASSALLLAVATTVWAQNSATRFGTLRVDSDLVLMFAGKPVRPKVQGNNSLTFMRTFQIGAKKDVVLIQDDGGTACPAVYHFVTVTPSGAKATKEFGSCSDLIKVRQKRDTIIVDMPGYVGQFASEARAKLEDRTRYYYTFKNGKLAETKKVSK